MQLRRPPSRSRSTVRELIDLGGAASLVCRKFSLPFFDFNWHVHPEVELTLIIAGRGTRHVGDSIDDVLEGEVVLIGPGTPHTWHSQPGSAVGSLCIQFPAEPLLAAGGGIPELASLSSLFARARRGLLLDRQLGGEVASVMHEISRERSPLRRLSLLLDALARIESSRDASPLASVAWQPPDSARDRALERVLRFVHEHRAQPLP
ncbi:MAG: AraC family ligand binding domain-containing protein, partial [Planctomycetes bacterium]|nr:AraC family ligand binding domain-containing protein [Planctomycetota bacterium]